MSDIEPAITIGGVPIPDDVEQHHVLLLGAPGTGKTVAVKELLCAIRRRGEGAVIYDPFSALARDLYNPERDVVINLDVDVIISPLDAAVTAEIDVNDLAGRFVFLVRDPGQDPGQVCGANLIERVVAHQAQTAGQKVWLVLDELPYDLPAATIEAALAEDSAITVIAAAQFRGQLAAHGYEALWATPRTRLVLCIRDPETADLTSRELGVEPGDLMALPPLSGYLILRMSNGYCLKTDVRLEM